jgi:hypothetical protein
MARGKKRREAKPAVRELDFNLLRMSLPHVEIKRGVEYQVQTTTGSKVEGDKVWICPMCVVEITQGVNHTVAWDVHRGVSSRRHFHNHCWKIFDGGLF